MSDKHPLIVFSGGMDSTYLLWKALEQGNVHTCYLNATQSQDKVPMEIAARKLITPVLERLTGNKVLTDSVLNYNKGKKLYVTTDGYDQNVNDPSPEDMTWGQAYLWIFGLLQLSNYRIHSEIQMGYILGDSISCRLDNIQQAWYHLQMFSKYKPLELNFPISLREKSQILDELPRELIRHIWTCELPAVSVDAFHEKTYEPCGHCHACRERKKLVYMWNEDNQWTTFEKHFIEDPTSAMEIKNSDGSKCIIGTIDEDNVETIASQLIEITEPEQA